MSESQGLYDKYTVARTDQQHLPGKKHHHCEYFVLDLTHDPWAVPALRAYASACVQENSQLARELEVRARYWATCAVTSWRAHGDNP